MKVLALLALSLSSLAIQAAESVDEQSLRTSLPIQIFMGTCVTGRADSGAVGQEAIGMGFAPAQDDVQARYLSGRPGQAWHMSTTEGEFGISVLTTGLCSVFIHSGDPQQLQASMEAWLPPENSGFSFEKEMVSQSGSLTTYLYKIYRRSELLEQWTITLNAQPDSGLSAIMSYDGA